MLFTCTENWPNDVWMQVCPDVRSPRFGLVYPKRASTALSHCYMIPVVQKSSQARVGRLSPALFHVCLARHILGRRKAEVPRKRVDIFPDDGSYVRVSIGYRERSSRGPHAAPHVDRPDLGNAGLHRRIRRARSVHEPSCTGLRFVRWLQE